jgi:ferredoxin
MNFSNFTPKKAGSDFKKIPDLFSDKKECCGCGLCAQICKEFSKGAIIMKEDEEGFLYPKIDSNKCVGCFLCLKKCPFPKAKIK